ncbi:MAG: ribosomal protein L7/L12 [Armatimonadota bacterium]|nr:ribosomal protein L7/L12 [Armatimonadota bacterium]
MSHDLPLFIVLALYGFLMPFWPRRAGRDDQLRLTRLESKVNLLLDKLGIEHDTASEEVRDYLAQGKKIHAIKAYREQNRPIGLKEAKDAVEAIEAQIKTQSYR